MAWQDEIALKRQESQAQKATKDLHDQNIDAVLGGSENVVASTKDLAKSSDIDSVIAQLKEVQLASILGASKPSVILTDQTDLGDKMTALGDKIASTIKQLDSSSSDSQQVKLLQDLNKAFSDYVKSEATDDKADVAANKALLTAIKAIDISPVVNVPAPKVTVQAAKVDLSPLQDTLKQYLSQDSDDDEDSFDLDDYYAQDIDNTNPNMQYVGFVSPTGAWYIIENDVKGNKLRYVFGNQNYEQAFSEASRYTYLLLNEAINAIPA